jgi:hypothetical protein
MTAQKQDIADSKIFVSVYQVFEAGSILDLEVSIDGIVAGSSALGIDSGDTYKSLISSSCFYDD